MFLLFAGCISLQIWTSVSLPSFWPNPVSFKADGVSECRFRQPFAFSMRKILMNEGSDAPISQIIASSVQRYNQNYAKIVSSVKFRSGSTCRVATCELNVRNPQGRIADDTKSESYEIEFDDDKDCEILCETAFGCMHGMQTFLQMLDPLQGNKLASKFYIKDQPAFSYRGLLLDTSRHFIPTSLILENIDLMVATKMNVLHWHISDDPSFPLELECCPHLSGKGSFSERAKYSKLEVREIVEYAAFRGVRIIPELDIPGHTESWIKGYPELLGKAKSGIDPTREENYVFLEGLLKEVVELFSSSRPVYEGKPVIHLGGDETGDGWDTESIREWMKAKGLQSKADLIAIWVSRLSDIAKKLDFRIMMWDDFLGESNQGSIPKFGDADNPIIWQTWRSSFEDSVTLSSQLSRQMVFSRDFYLDHLQDDWTTFYSIKVNQFRKGNVIGGEACMWGEWVDDSNLISRVWPRTAAVAERLWSGVNGESSDFTLSASKRLAKWRCRMREFFGYREIEPIGPIRVQHPDEEMVWHTDKEGWYCAESSLSFNEEGLGGERVIMTRK